MYRSVLFDRRDKHLRITVPYQHTRLRRAGLRVVIDTLFQIRLPGCKQLFTVRIYNVILTGRTDIRQFL